MFIPYKLLGFILAAVVLYPIVTYFFDVTLEEWGRPKYGDRPNHERDCVCPLCTYNRIKDKETANQ